MRVSVFFVFMWLVVISLAFVLVILSIAGAGNTTYMLFATLLAVVSAHFIVVIIAAATAKLIIEEIRKEIRKIRGEIKELLKGER